MRSARALIGLALALATIVVVAPPAGAVGVGVFPQEIVVESALRGAEHVQTLGVINDSDEPRVVTFAAEGAAGSWVAVLDPNDPTLRMERIVVPAGARVFSSVRIAVPGDVANGDYEAVLQVVSASLDDGDDASSVGIGVTVPIRITVTGTQVLSGELGSFAAGDTEVGVPMRWEVAVSNSGNVNLDPEVTVEITDPSGRVLATSPASGVTIPPGEARTLEGEWDTRDVVAGDYTAQVRATARTVTIGTADDRFVVFPRGHFTRRIELVQVSLVNEPAPGGIGIVAVQFANVGEIEAVVTFEGEFIREGQLLDRITSLERRIAPGESALIEVYVDVPRDGVYTVTGRAVYGDSESAPRDVSFRVGEAPRSFVTRWGWWIMAGGSAAVILMIVAVSLMRRRRAYLPRRRPSHPRIR